MNKPITVAKAEFTESLVTLVNESGLPAFVLRSIFREVDTILAQQELSQYESDKAKWEASQKEGKNG